MADGGIRVTVKLDASSLVSSARQAGRAATLAAGEAILSRAVSLAPRRTGAMAASGSVRLSGDTAVVTFGSDYALYQHEGTGFAHPGGGQARFLAEAVDGAEALAAMEAAFRANL